MKSERLTSILAVISLAVVLPIALAAQETARLHQPHQYHHYQLIDVGTFGGPQSWQFSPGVARSGILNNQGTLVGSADTSVVDPYCFWSLADCYATDALQWHDGVTTNLGVLAGGIGSQVNWISANGLMAGVSDNGQQDPLNPALPQVHAVFWNHGRMTDLGTFAGGYDTWANAVNNRGEIAAQAYNTIPDSNSLFGYGYQSRAYYWNNGVMQDLGTLGTGTDADAVLINDQGQVVVVSYINSIPNPTCASISAFNLTTGSFLWDRKNGMKDIGGLGGACTLANDLNNRGQIVGGSSLTGDTTVHPFVWNAASGITDLLNPSDSSYGFAEGENAHGDVAGGTCDSVTCYAVLWRKSGGRWQKTNLSTVTDNAFSVSTNSSEQVVGNVGTNSSAPFLWEDGGPIVDLNTLVPPGSGLQLIEAHQINDRGEVAISALGANGNNHSVLLIPCDENHADVQGCDYSLVDASTAAQSAAPRSIPNSTQRSVHPWRSNRFHSSAVGGAATLTSQISPAPDFTRPPVFWVSATPLTPSPVNPGGSSTSSVTAGVGTNGGGAGTVVTLSCSVQPSPPLAPVCLISPGSYTFGGTPSTLTVSTFGPSGRLLSHPGSGVLYALWLPIIGLVGTGIGLGTNPNRKKGKLKTALLTCALFLGLAFQFACGGGKTSSGTPAGAYQVTVTATGFIPVASTASLTMLTVQ